MRIVMVILVSSLSVLSLAACSSGSPPSDGGSSEGADLFSSAVLGGQSGCVTCHSLEPDLIVVGPSLSGVGERAETRVSAQSARACLRTSIVDPDAYVVDGFDGGRMPSNWAEVLTETEIDALVDFLEGL